jgi:hypothetical protein
VRPLTAAAVGAGYYHCSSANRGVEAMGQAGDSPARVPGNAANS